MSATAAKQWSEVHGFGEMSYDWYMGWYETRPSYTVGDEKMGRLDREAIEILAAGRGNFTLMRDRAAAVVAAWPHGKI